MVIDKICKMTVKGIKSKSKGFFSISHGVLELWTKNLRGRIPPPGMDRVKELLLYNRIEAFFENFHQKWKNASCGAQFRYFQIR